MHDATGIDAPVDAFLLARACGLLCVPGPRSKAFLDGETVYYDNQAREVRQHGLIAHEVAHYVLRLHGEDDSEDAARYTAGALMLPRVSFDRDLRESWDLRALLARHPHVSAELCARRIAQLRDAVVTVLDQGRVRSRVDSSGVVLPKRMTTVERDLADAALTTDSVQRANDFLAAYPFIDGQYRRVIVVAEARQLRLDV